MSQTYKDTTIDQKLSEPYTDLGSRLKALRQKHGLSQEEFANALRLSKSAVSMYERGERKPHINILKRIVQNFNVDYNYLHGFECEGPIDNLLLRERRLQLNMTMLDVAKKVGVSEGTISRWESGEIANMRRDKIVALANALQISPGAIVGAEESPTVRLTELEELVVRKYRENPQMHEAVHRLLGIN